MATEARRRRRVRQLISWRRRTKRPAFLWIQMRKLLTTVISHIKYSYGKNEYASAIMLSNLLNNGDGPALIYVVESSIENVFRINEFIKSVYALNSSSIHGKYWRGILWFSMKHELAYSLTNQVSQSFEAVISVCSCGGTRSSVMLRDMDVPTSNIVQLLNAVWQNTTQTGHVPLTFDEFDRHNHHKLSLYGIRWEDKPWIMI